MSTEYILTQTSFEEIYLVWKDKLWPNRESEIRPYSTIKYLGGKNPEIAKFARPVFYKLVLGKKIIGVNSGHLTSTNEYRNRGIWIDPEYRGQSLSRLFFTQSLSDAKSMGCNLLWSLPRKTAIKSYISYGFEITSGWDDFSYEFGPNCFVKLGINI